MIKTRVSKLPSNVDVLFEFPNWITQYCNDTSVVLDVGAGKGRHGDPAIIRPKVARLVGIDPDVTITLNPYLDEQYQVSLEDFAKERTSDFDCLYMMFVLEHINNPYQFLSACRSLLKPGGMLFGATPNLWHYFGMTTKFSASLGIEDWLLEHLIGAQRKDAYHFPTAYSLNSISRISRMLTQTGFREVEFRCFDHPQSFEYVFPKRLRWFPSFYSHFVYKLGLPHFMGLIMFRASA